MRIHSSDKKMLAKMAVALPSLQQSEPDGTPAFKWRKVRGSELLADDPQATDQAGHPIAANKGYWRRVPMLVDHYHQLTSAFLKDGMPGARRYCDEVKAFVSGARKPRPWWQRKWYAFLLRIGITTEYMRQQAERMRWMSTTPANLNTMTR